MRVGYGRMGVVPAGLLAAALLTACNSGKNVTGSGASGGAPPGTSAGAASGAGVPVGQPGGEVESVKAMLKKMSEEKDFAAIGQYMSNRSAAAFGMVMMLPLGMMIAFADMGQDFGKALAGSGGQAAPPKPDPKMAELKTELEALNKKYGMDSKQPGEDDAKRLEGRGREFFQDVAGLFDKLSKSEAGKGKMEPPKPNDMVKNMEDLEFAVVSPTEVKITSKSKKDPPARAIVEDGAWRLDFGGMEEMAKQMGASKAGGPTPAPPGPGAPPSTP